MGYRAALLGSHFQISAWSGGISSKLLTKLFLQAPGSWSIFRVSWRVRIRSWAVGKADKLSHERGDIGGCL